jgi:hypothetical protein
MGNRGSSYDSSLHIPAKFQDNVLARIVDDYVTGPHVIQSNLSGIQDADFLEETIPLLQEDVPLHIC